MVNQFDIHAMKRSRQMENIQVAGIHEKTRISQEEGTMSPQCSSRRFIGVVLLLFVSLAQVLMAATYPVEVVQAALGHLQAALAARGPQRPVPGPLQDRTQEIQRILVIIDDEHGGTRGFRLDHDPPHAG